MVLCHDIAIDSIELFEVCVVHSGDMAMGYTQQIAHKNACLHVDFMANDPQGKFHFHTHRSVVYLNKYFGNALENYIF